MGINTTTSALLYKHVFMPMWLEWRTVVALLEPGWVIPFPAMVQCLGRFQVYYTDKRRI